MIGTALLLPTLLASLSLPAPTPAPTFDMGLREAYEAITAPQAWPGQELVLPTQERPVDSISAGFGRRIVIDLGELGRVPFHMSSKRWQKFGLGLALVGTAALFDDELNEGSDRFRDSAGVRAGRAIRPLGQEAGLALLGATWLAGRSLDRPGWVGFAQDGLEATILTAVIVAPLKEVVGRSRPRDTSSAQAFGPFSGQLSFPSGEAAQAFTLATVAAAHTDRAWVKISAYGLASLVALARVELDAHWASDIVAGALIGHAVGRFVAGRQADRLGKEARVHWQVAPGYDRERHTWSLGGVISF